jgi:hypothetical protein
MSDRDLRDRGVVASALPLLALIHRAAWKKRNCAKSVSSILRARGLVGLLTGR